MRQSNILYWFTEILVIPNLYGNTIISTVHASRKVEKNQKIDRIKDNFMLYIVHKALNLFFPKCNNT